MEQSVLRLVYKKEMIQQMELTKIKSRVKGF